jgi:copper chaperone
MSERSFTVEGLTCDHCVHAVTSEVSKLAGVVKVDVDLATGHVLVVGSDPVDDWAVRAAVAEAGYEVMS